MSAVRRMDRAGTFAPAPGSAPLHRMVLAQAAIETRLLLRNGEQVLLAVVIPLVVLVAGVLAGGRFELTDGRAVDVLAPGVLALAVMSTSFTSLAIATGFERRYGVLKRLGASPLPRAGLLGGKVAALLVVEAFQVVVLTVAAALLGWDPRLTTAGVVGAAAVVLAGTAAFAALGLLLAGALRAEATLAAANLVYLLLLAGGAVVLPLSAYGAAGDLVAFLPSAALGTGLRESLGEGSFPGAELALLGGWAVLGTAVTTRTFRWE